MLIVARSVAGLGASGLLNGGMTMISACLPKHKRPCMAPISLLTREASADNMDSGDGNDNFQ